MDVDDHKSHKWHGSKEKKWEWYKHTKACNNVLNSGICTNTDCNYAHTVEQYVEAVKKRHFVLDTNIVNQLYLATLPKSNKQKRSFESYDNPVKRQRQDY